jgi:hypothetical protein
MTVTKYFKSSYPRGQIAAITPPGVNVTIAYIDKGSSEYIREVSGDEDAVEQFRAAIDGVEVGKPAAIIDPVTFMLLFPIAARVALRNSTDPVIVDFLRMLDDPRLSVVDRNKPVVIEAIDYVAAAVSIAQDDIERIKTGI